MGRNGLDTLDRMGTDESANMSAIYAEERHSGERGIALAIARSGLPSGIASSGSPEQIGRWVPECYGATGVQRVVTHLPPTPSRRLSQPHRVDALLRRSSLRRARVNCQADGQRSGPDVPTRPAMAPRCRRAAPLLR